MRRTLAVFGIWTVLVSTAHAYQLRKNKDNKVLIWGQQTIQVVIDTSNVPRVSGSVDAVESAFASWTDAGVPVRVKFRQATASMGHGNDKQNVIRWETEKWPFAEEVVAMTVSSYKKSTGFVSESDIVLNGVRHEWTTDPGSEPRKYDVENVLAHEVGHFLGMGHADGKPEATMFATTPVGEDKKRSLGDDDLDGIAALVQEITERGVGAGPAEEIDGEAADVGAGGCSVGQSGEGDDLWLGLMVLALVATRLRRRLPRTGSAIAVLLLILVPAAAEATVVYHLSVKQLVGRANVVVEGEVLDRQSLWVGDRIVTEHLVQVTRCHKGPCEAVLTVRLPGGEVGDDAMHIDGTPKMTVGQKVMLFGRNQLPAVRLVGMAQGMFQLRQGQALRDLRGLQLLRPGQPLADKSLSGATVADHGRHAVQRVSLEKLRRAVQMVSVELQQRREVATPHRAD